MKLNDSNLFRQQALINGEWLDANDGEVIDVTNPANGDKLGSVPKMGADETRAAIDAANRALPAWRALTAKERANILRNWFNLMMEHQDDLARLMTSNRANRWLKRKAKLATPPPLLSGLLKKVNAFMATPFLVIRPISA